MELAGRSRIENTRWMRLTSFCWSCNKGFYHNTHSDARPVAAVSRGKEKKKREKMEFQL
jgi:hypothetical protein